MSEVLPWDLVAEGYDETSRPFLGQFSQAALPLLGLEPSHEVLDVACGPGTTCLLLAGKVKRLVGIDFSPAMLARAQENLGAAGHNEVPLIEGDGQALPFSDNSFDAALSMFGLMFFPDRLAGMRELFRVVRPGGRVLLSSWAPVDMSPAMTAMFGALRAIDPSRPEPQRNLLNLENPDLFASELEQAGFTEISVTPHEEQLTFRNPESFWDDMVKGSAPFALLRSKIGEEQFAHQSAIARAHLRQTLGTKTSLGSTAYLAVARRPVV